MKSPRSVRPRRALARPWTRWAAALGLLAGLGTSAPARAASVSLTDSGQVVRWSSAAMRYHLHPSCSADLAVGTCLDAVRAGFAAWTGHACSSASFSEQGFSNSLKLTAVGYSTNGNNELAWIETSQWYYGTYTLAVTAPVFYDDGSIIEADIAFNGYLQTWSVSGQNYSTDVLSVTVHEIGHYFGLQHNLSQASGEPPTMAPTADPFMRSRTPEADDVQGLCFLYPAGSFSCQVDADCPLVVESGPQGEVYAGRIPCESGSCGGFSSELPEGEGALGDPCVASSDCGPPYFCQGLGGGGGVCGQSCNPAAGDCPDGFACVPYSNSPGGVCLEDTGGGGTRAGNGEPCEYSSDCESGLCLTESGGRVCRQPCLHDGHCAAGEACTPLSGTGFGACADAVDEPSGGGKANGEPCQSSAECESELCAGSGLSYHCTSWCTSPAQCPPGQDCLALSGGGGACFGDEEKGVGEGCSSGAECGSGLCVSMGDTGAFCTDACASAADCPCGMECLDTSEGALCGPGVRVACVPDGQACGASPECESGRCVDGLCETVCSIFQKSGVCGDGQACGRREPGSPEGRCRAPGPNPVGQPCGQDNACESLLCHEGVCETPCNPWVPSTCGGGQVCVTVVADVGRCFDPPPPTGGADAGGADAGSPDSGSTDSGGAGPDAGGPGPGPADAAGPDRGGSPQADTGSGGSGGGEGGGTLPPPGGSGDGEGGNGVSSCAGAGSDAGPLPWLALALLGALRRRRRP